MMIVLHPTYTLRVEVQDQYEMNYDKKPGCFSDGRRFFNSASGKTGCDEVMAVVKEALLKAGLDHFAVSLERYEQRGSI